MEIDQELNKVILAHLREHPAPQPSGVWRDFARSNGDEKKLLEHMLYLEEHGLIRSGVVRSADGNHMVNTGVMNITAKGRDVLAADGGLSAVLNTVTIKIHEDSLERIERFLARNARNQSEASDMSSRLRSLPAAAIEHFSMKIMDLAMEKLPAEVFRLIQRAIGPE
ncbi:MAG: hypothetical protein LBQ51_05580 [Desulfovibrio sp.]|nr:hypothetical protein [Desulfovibrio sp.]